MKGTILLSAIGTVLLGAALAFGPASAEKKAPVSPAPTAIPPEVHDTATNVQVAFDREVNAKSTYVEVAKEADREGYPGVARLFRACARAEEAHADRCVEAIASTGGTEARAHLGRPSVGTTEQNLKTAIEAERYDVESFYPLFIEQARAESRTKAVRSLTFAHAAEREHLDLLTAALEHLGAPPGSPAYYVCPYCGKTVATLEFSKCPNCFTSAKKFVCVN
jgi:rubrerythrin